MGDPARNLPRTESIALPMIEREDVVFSGKNRIRQVTEKGRGLISILALALRIVDALSEEPAGRSGLETSYFEAELAQAVAERRDSVTHPAAFLIAQSDMEQPAHERSRGDDDRARPKTHSEIGFDACGGVIFNKKPSNVALFEIQPRLFLKNCLHAKLVGFLVTLGPWRADAGSFARV
jgi:hypothetical protein